MIDSLCTVYYRIKGWYRLVEGLETNVLGPVSWKGVAGADGGEAAKFCRPKWVSAQFLGRFPEMESFPNGCFRK